MSLGEDEGGEVATVGEFPTIVVSLPVDLRRCLMEPRAMQMEGSQKHSLSLSG